ncbi:hypothetical protein [Bacillus sp. MRMR6]|uniref:hypothetical protein n=1 Tax=Bacillus sp. MRMR6 TaxID=1928617 RepID=UPI0009512943|nr:hypothetical protein [Bacillus sp. MRMR6]OLS33742.1 hypothetical protein BTR25_24240 [Bacillus sp. MRMR6]
MTLLTYLNRRANVKGMERLLFTEDWLTVSTSIGLGVSSYRDFDEQERYREWKEEFSESYQQKLDDFNQKRFEQLEEYKGLLEENDITSHVELKEASDVLDFAKKLHDNDILQRWRFEKFFAEEGNEGAKQVLGYCDYIDGESIHNLYSNEQFKELLERGKVTVDDSPLQGHHINDFSSNSTVQENIITLFHGNNIKLMTRSAHLNDPEHGHGNKNGEGGSWKNETKGEANEIDQRFNNIVDANKEITAEDIASFHINTGVGIGLLFGTVTSILEYRKLKNDPRPWKKKALLISMSSIVKGVEAGTLTLLALKTRLSVSSIGDSELLITRVDDANGVLNGLFGGDGVPLEPESIAEFVGFGVSIAEIRIIRSAIVALVQWKHSDFKTAKNQFGKESFGIMAEEAVFLVTVMTAHTLIKSLAYEAGQDAIIPDPTGGFIVVTRVSWSIFKKSYQYINDRKTMDSCKQKRLDGLYETAIASLTYMG